METVWSIISWVGTTTIAMGILIIGVFVTIALYQAIQVLGLIIREKEKGNEKV